MDDKFYNQEPGTRRFVTYGIKDTNVKLKKLFSEINELERAFNQACKELESLTATSYDEWRKHLLNED